MAASILTAAERARLQSFPEEIPEEDLLRCFALSDADLRHVAQQRRASNRLAFAIQLCALRYLGFCPDDLSAVPSVAVAYVARQIGVEPELGGYGKRLQTRSQHQKKLRPYLGFRRPDRKDVSALQRWLVDRCLEHDNPVVLLGLACEWLHREKILRPRLGRLERWVVSAQAAAVSEIHRRLRPLLTAEQEVFLDGLLVPEPKTGRTPLYALRTAGTSNRAKDILAALERLASLQEAGVDGWDLSAVNPNRLKVLARIGARATNQYLQRLAPKRRYPILLAFLRQALEDVTDEVLHMFERCLWEVYVRSCRDFDEHWSALRESTNEKLRWFQDIGSVILDPQVRNPDVRAAVFERITQSRLAQAIDETEKIVRPQEDGCFDFFASHYGYFRRFVPRLLELIEFEGSPHYETLLAAVGLLRALDAAGGSREIPAAAPLDFVDGKWRPYVLGEKAGPRRRYYELCTLWQLREALRTGNVWVASSRRYAALETYLIPRHRWAALRGEFVRMTGTPDDASIRLKERESALTARLARLDEVLGHGGEAIRVEDGALVVSPTAAEDRPAGAVELENALAGLLPVVDLPDLLIEVDSWTKFSSRFQHAGGATRRRGDVLSPLYASLVAHACNFGLHQMESIADIPYERLEWCSTWYLREDSLRSALAAIVDYHHRLPLTRVWGGGTLSSSDGQRFPAASTVRKAVALPRYFGYKKGLTFYTWTSDQFSQYGSKVVPTTTRDATYVLDEILDNETELTILEHTSDTAGYTEIVFALFDLLGMRFAPRIRDLDHQKLYRLDSIDLRRYPRLRGRIAGVLSKDKVVKSWDELLRVAGSLKLGWVTASLLVEKLQRLSETNALVASLQRYGQLMKTLHVLEWYANQAFRRRISTMLNKGEALHSLRSTIRHANKGVFRRGHDEALANEAGCLNLVVNAIITWNSVYMAHAIAKLRAEGRSIQNEDLAHIWPTRHEHINVHGKLKFNVEEARARTGLRPLARPKAFPGLLPIP